MTALSITEEESHENGDGPMIKLVNSVKEPFLVTRLLFIEGSQGSTLSGIAFVEAHHWGTGAIQEDCRYRILGGWLVQY